MSEASENVFQAAMAFPADGRPFADEWLAEVHRRSAEIDAGTVALTPWSEVKARVRKRLEERMGGKP